MMYVEDWNELMFGLQCFSKASAQKKFRQQIRYSWGGICAYCREERATTVDHIKPKCKGGSSFRSNLIPCCVDCNHSKGSRDWRQWFSEQIFYSQIAEDLIDEWIENKRYVELESNDGQHDGRRTKPRTAICITKSEVRSKQDEPLQPREDCCQTAEVKNRAEEWNPADSSSEWDHYENFGITAGAA